MLNNSKRFSDAELAAELWFKRWVRSTALRLSDVGGPSELDNERLATLRRFATLPHYDEDSIPYEPDTSFQEWEV